MIHLPAALLELLGATVGRTEISVAWQEGLQPPPGRRLVLSCVQNSLASSTVHQAGAGQKHTRLLGSSGLET